MTIALKVQHAVVTIFKILHVGVVASAEPILQSICEAQFGPHLLYVVVRVTHMPLFRA
jgi:hypothetical protein